MTHTKSVCGLGRMQLLGRTFDTTPTAFQFAFNCSQVFLYSVPYSLWCCWAIFAKFIPSKPERINI